MTILRSFATSVGHVLIKSRLSIRIHSQLHSSQCGNASRIGNIATTPILGTLHSRAIGAIEPISDHSIKRAPAHCNEANGPRNLFSDKQPIRYFIIPRFNFIVNLDWRAYLHYGNFLIYFITFYYPIIVTYNNCYYTHYIFLTFSFSSFFFSEELEVLYGWKLSSRREGVIKKILFVLFIRGSRKVKLPGTSGLLTYGHANFVSLTPSCPFPSDARFERQSIYSAC